VDREVDSSVEESFFDFFREDTFAADFVERYVEDFVACGFDDLNSALGPTCLEALSDVVRLPEG